MPTLKDTYGTETAVWQAFSPSAIVDSKGDLYIITFNRFKATSYDSGLNDTGSGGPHFKIGKYSNGSESYVYRFQPWKKIPGVTPNCQSNPTFDHSSFSGISLSEEEEKKHFKNYIHNAFIPYLAQEVGANSSEYLYGFVYIPTTRLMNIQVNKSDYSGAETGGTEGMLFFKVKKMACRI